MRVLGDRIWIKVKNAYLKVTFSRSITAFFLFGFIHCFVQGIIQSLLYTTDTTAFNLANSIVQHAQIPVSNFAWVHHTGNFARLQICNAIPWGPADQPCGAQATFETDASALQDPVEYAHNVSTDVAPDVTDVTSLIVDNGLPPFGVTLKLKDGTERALDKICTQVMVYPKQTLMNFQREDLTLLAMQFWLLYVSFVAVLYDSVPHTLTVLAARLLVTAWSASSMARLQELHIKFELLIRSPTSACSIDLFSEFFTQRFIFQLADLVLNCTALLLSCYLSMNMLKEYSKHTFQRVGPPPQIVRIYRYFLALYVCLQLASFCLVTAMGLWIDQLRNTAIDHISTHTTIYNALCIFTSILFIPWVIMGWFAVRREMKKVMAVFLFIGFAFLVGWSVMFYSLVFRWSFLMWPWFACITVEALIVLVTTLILGVVCLRNFNKGLAHYLYVEEQLSSDDFETDVFPHDIEKGDKDGFEAKLDQYAARPVYLPPLEKGNGYGTSHTQNMYTQ